MMKIFQIIVPIVIVSNIIFVHPWAGACTSCQASSPPPSSPLQTADETSLQSHAFIQGVFEAWASRETRIQTAHFVWDDVLVMPRGSLGYSLLGKSSSEPPTDISSNKRHEFFLTNDGYRHEIDGPAWSGIHKKTLDTKFIKVLTSKENASLFDTFKSADTGVGFVKSVDVAEKLSETLDNIVVFLQFRPNHTNTFIFDPKLWHVAKKTDFSAENSNIICIEYNNPSSSATTRLYIDKSKEFLVVRMEMWNSSTLQVREDIEYKKQHDEWAPTSWNSSMFADNSQLRQGSKGTMKLVELNVPIDPLLMHLTFPDKTEIVDIDKTISYIIDDSGKKLFRTPADGSGPIRKRDTNNTTINRTTKLIIIFLVPTVVFVLLMFRLKKKSK